VLPAHQGLHPAHLLFCNVYLGLEDQEELLLLNATPQVAQQ
jgi:hypothetical protein